MQKHIDTKIYGKVQGVGFRRGVKRLSLKLGLTGWVKNLPDGSVHLSVEGESDKVDALINWCRTGTLLAQVKHLKITSNNLEGFTEFLIMT